MVRTMEGHLKDYLHMQKAVLPPQRGREKLQNFSPPMAPLALQSLLLSKVPLALRSHFPAVWGQGGGCCERGKLYFECGIPQGMPLLLNQVHQSTYSAFVISSHLGLSG